MYIVNTNNKHKHEYLLTDADISMFLQQQLNYCHMTFPAGDVESSCAILCMYDICNNESYTSLSPVYNTCI